MNWYSSVQTRHTRTARQWTMSCRHCVQVHCKYSIRQGCSVDVKYFEYFTSLFTSGGWFTCVSASTIELLGLRRLFCAANVHTEPHRYLFVNKHWVAVSTHRNFELVIELLNIYLTIIPDKLESYISSYLLVHIRRERKSWSAVTQVLQW